MSRLRSLVSAIDYRLLTNDWSSGASYFYITVLGFLLGVFVCSFVSLGIFTLIVLISVAAIFLVLVAMRQLPKSALLLVFLLGSFIVGAVRVSVVPDVYEPFRNVTDSKVVLEGKVVRDPERRERTTQLVVEVSSINGAASGGKVLVTADRLADVAYADTVKVEGKLSLPQSFETETGKEFDYPGYLRAKGIGAVVSFPHVDVVDPAGETFLGSLYTLKHSFEYAIERIMPEPASGLLEGILLGNKDALGEKWYEIFIIAGLVHIVVLSGYNLSIIADMLARLLSRAPKKVALIVGAVGIISFALMVGAEATVIRAAIMALVVIVGRALKRPHALMRALVLACGIMVLHNPLILASDPSFALSFLATFGLVTFGTLLESKLFFIPTFAGLRGIAAATLATQIFVLPALIFYTGRLSVVALLTNMLALPLIPSAMLFGFIAGVVGLVSQTLGVVAMVPAWVLLSIVTEIAHLASLIPGASISVATLQTPLIFGLYVILVPLSLYAIRKTTRNPERFSSNQSMRTLP